MIDPFSQLRAADPRYYSDKTRQACTPTNPYSPDKEGRWFHPDATYVRGEDYYDVWDCPWCKLRFREELAE